MWRKIQWVLDWVGRWQAALWLYALIPGAIVSGAFAALSEAPLWALALLFLASTMIAIGGLIFWQNYHSDMAKTAEAIVEARDNTSPLTIHFPSEHSCSEFVQEPAQVFQGKVWRKIVWVNIQNTSDHNVKNIRAEIGSFRYVKASGAEETHPLIASKTFPLRFQDGQTVLDCSPHMPARLNMISYARQFMASSIRIEGADREALSHQILHECKSLKFTVKVTADDFMPVQREFIASVDGGGLQVSTCD